MPGTYSYEWFYAGVGSNRETDLDDYGKLLIERYERLDQAGYDVIQIVPINAPQWWQSTARNGTYVGDATFSVTQGAVIVGKARSA